MRKALVVSLLVLAAAVSLLLISAPCHAQQNYINSVLSDNPTAYWTLGDPVNTVNPVELVHNLYTYPVWDCANKLGAAGVVSGTTSWKYEGPATDTYQFAPYWEIDHCPEIDIDNGQDFALEAWFKSVTPLQYYPSYLLSKTPAYGSNFWGDPRAGGGYAMVTDYNGGPFKGWSLHAGIYGGGSTPRGTTNQNGGWQYCVVTQTNGVCSIYEVVNDVVQLQDSQTNNALAPLHNGGPLFLGGSPHYIYFCVAHPPCTIPDNFPFHGSLAHVAIYKHALTSDRIQAHYNKMYGLGGGGNGDPIDIQKATKARGSSWGRLKGLYR